MSCASSKLEPEVPGLCFEDAAVFFDLGFPLGEVFVGDGGEVVEVVEVETVEWVYGGVDIAGHGEVEEEEGFAGAFAEGLLDGLIGEDVTRCSGGADDDIKAVELSGEVFEIDRSTAELTGEFLSVFEGSAADRNIGDPATGKCLRGGGADFAGAEEEYAALIEVPEDAVGEIGGDVTDADMAAIDAGLTACGFGGLETFFKEAAEDGADGLGGFGAGVSVFDLSEDFGFAHNLGVESGGDFAEVLESIEVLVPVGVLLEVAGLDVALIAEILFEGGQVIQGLGESVDLGAVAGAEYEAFF